MTEECYDEDGFRLSFESDTDPAEKRYFMRLYPNVSKIAESKVHCTACQTHIGTAPVSETIIRMHPVLRVTHCRSCHAFYNSGEFDKGEDGSELYCRWCGQGGEVYCCSKCPYVFCKSCILKNLSKNCVQDIARNENWDCFGCAPKIMWHLRAQHWALMNFIEKQKKDIQALHHLPAIAINNLLKQDLTTCCPNKGSRSKGANQSGSKKQAKRNEDDADNVPLAKMKNDISGVRSADGTRLEKPSPSPSSMSISSPKPSGSGSKPQKKLKQKQSRTPDEEHQSPAPPPQKKTKTGDNEVVCTPDIMSMFTQMEEARAPVAASQTANSSVFAVGSVYNMPSNNFNAPSGPGPASVDMQPNTPVATSSSAAKPRAILHNSMGRSVTVRLASADAASSQQANSVPDPKSQFVRLSPTASGRQLGAPNVYHTINGFRVDLHTAAQQGTYRLPNGKLIQVRRQASDTPASTVGVTRLVPDLSTILACGI